MGKLSMRQATVADAAILYHWDEKPHVKAAVSNDGQSSFEANWEEELAERTDGTEFLIAEVDGQAIGAVQIIDPATEQTHYWGEVEANLRALDIWIGEETFLGQGYGTGMMNNALSRCFAEKQVTAVLIDPLANNVRSQRFYERFGFVFVERRRFDEDSDCFVYRLERADWTNAAPIAKTPQPPYYAVIFTSLKTGNDSGYGDMAEKMLALAAKQPGFLGVESARDGVGITVSYWADLESIKHWKEHAAHREAQKLGYEQWYSGYKTRIARVEREYGVFPVVAEQTIRQGITTS